MPGMNFSTEHFTRYRQIAQLLWKYGRSDLVQQMKAQDGLDPGEMAQESSAEVTPEKLADDLEAMGPVYVKLGQVLSSRPDLLPEPYLKALARLQDKVKPFAYAEVEAIVAEELGVKISKAFSHFESVPMAAASLGQVHAAALRDGRQVVVKVQRPGIAKQVTEDFEVLAQIAEFVDAHTELGRRYRFLDLLEEFRVAIHQELDYVREAQNLVAVGKNLAQFELIEIPQPVPDYSTRRVLTMDYVRGRKLTSLGPLATMEMDGEALAEELFKAYLKQVLVDGLFHADPHPGNVFLTNERRIALLDLGMAGRTTPAMQEHLLKLLLEVSEGRGEEAGQVIISMSRTDEELIVEEFLPRVGKRVAKDQGLPQFSMGKTLLDLSRIAGEQGIRVPSELTLLGKTLLQLDEIGRILNPAFDTNASIHRNVGELMAQRARKFGTQEGFFNSLLEVKEFVVGLPSRLNRIMDAVGNSELEVKVRAMDADMLMEGFQKIANRITTGIILASLIVGAALLMRVETPFQIFGYPGLAILCFLAAAAGGFWLVIAIFVQDRRNARKSKLPARAGP
jgi:ubiquinone biosynthesis protein